MPVVFGTGHCRRLSSLLLHVNVVTADQSNDEQSSPQRTMGPGALKDAGLHGTVLSALTSMQSRLALSVFVLLTHTVQLGKLLTCFTCGHPDVAAGAWCADDDHLDVPVVQRLSNCLHIHNHFSNCTDSLHQQKAASDSTTPKSLRQELMLTVVTLIPAPELGA